MQIEFILEIVLFAIISIALVSVKLKFANKMFIADGVSIFVSPDEKSFEEYRKNKSKKDKTLNIGLDTCSNKKMEYMPCYNECDIIVILSAMLACFVGIKSVYKYLVVPIFQYNDINLMTKESGMNYYIAATIFTLGLYQAIKI